MGNVWGMPSESHNVREEGATNSMKTVQETRDHLRMTDGDMIKMTLLMRSAAVQINPADYPNLEMYESAVFMTAGLAAILFYGEKDENQN